jgi:hypothetical protein
VHPSLSANNESEKKGPAIRFHCWPVNSGHVSGSGCAAAAACVDDVILFGWLLNSKQHPLLPRRNRVREASCQRPDRDHKKLRKQHL